MSFYHDIYRIKNADGTARVIEIEYSLEDCVRRGWFDPEKCQWIRQEVPPPNEEPDWEKDGQRRDPNFGRVFHFMLKES